MAKASNNLKRLVEELEELENKSTYAALLDVTDKHLDEFMNILEQQVMSALSSSKEYNDPVFSTGLMSAIRNTDVIHIGYLSGKLVVSIEMDSVAGRLEDYVRGVEAARAELSSKSKPANITQASHYWRIFLYGQAREGREIKVTKGFRSIQGDVYRFDYRKGEGRYERTIESRLENSTGLAPWWKLLDKGVAGAGFPSRGGTAYPPSSPTNFVDTSRLLIESLATRYYEEELKNLKQRLEIELDRKYARELERDIVDVVRNFDADKARTQPKPTTSIFTEVIEKSINFFTRVARTIFRGRG